MSRTKSQDMSRICRWAAVGMGNHCGLEARFDALLRADAKRQAPGRVTPWLATGFAIVGTMTLSAFQFGEASAHARAAAKSSVATTETHRVVPNGDDAVLPEGVTVHAIGATEISVKGDSDARSSDRVWWHPNGTLYSSPPLVGGDPKMRNEFMPIPPRLRRLQFAIRIDNSPKQQDTAFGPISSERFAGSSEATMTRLPGGLVWLFYCSVPDDAQEESLTVLVSHGPWKETLRRPLAWSPASPRQSWGDLRSEILSRSPGKTPRVLAASDPFATQHVYPLASAKPGTAEFGVRLTRRDVTDGTGNDWRYFLLDKDGHRLNSRNLQESSWKSDFLVKFSTDEKTAGQAAFVGVESRPFTYVTFKHLAVRPKAR